MDLFGGFISILIILAIVAGFLKNVVGLFNDFYWYFSSVFNKHFIPLKASHRNILEKRLKYYNLLPPHEKKEFEKRLKAFMYSKVFIGRGMPEVTSEMRVLISASAIQLTFGLPMVYLSNFRKILIYPDTYYSNINKQYHHGEVNPRVGLIILSWKRFMDGYANDHDSLNVGLHEMAHAIHFEDRISNGEYGFLDQQALNNLHRIFLREQKNIRNGTQTYLRAYAATNEYEFFAVSIEHFFENPKGMMEAIPDLYRNLKELLNQDPLKLYGPYNK